MECKTSQAPFSIHRCAPFKKLLPIYCYLAVIDTTLVARFDVPFTSKTAAVVDHQFSHTHERIDFLGNFTLGDERCAAAAIKQQRATESWVVQLWCSCNEVLMMQF